MIAKQEPMAGTQAILRAVTMLEQFSDEQSAWTISDLADAVRLNRTTVYRLLTALESVEYVVRDPATDTYHLGSGLIALGGRAARANPVRMVSQRELAALARDTGETATLEILSGREIIIIEEMPGDYVTSGSQHIGSRWPLHATSTGKAILAYLSDESRALVSTPPFAALTERTITTSEGLRDCLAAVRRDGYAVAAEELEMGFVAVGAPLLDADGRPVAAISLGGTRTRLTDARVPEIGRLVRAAAGRISHQLGYRQGAASD